jgi:hypothetical protein
LIAAAFAGMFADPMDKKTNGGGSKPPRLHAGESMPPLLSEKLIAQLQGAVAAAQRKRMSKPIKPRL